MSTNSPSPAALDLRKRWWLWPLVPLAFLASVFGMVAFFVLIAICWPYLWLKSWREQAAIGRKLVSEHRAISWADALKAIREVENQLVVEIGPKGPGSMWLVELSVSSNNDLLACPTYAELETDPRAAWETCMTIDHASPQLVTYLRAAKRIEDPPSNLSELDSELKASIRVLTVFNEASPSTFLQRALQSDKDA